MNAGAGPAAAKGVADAVAAFLYREARLLDERRFEEWRELFAADGVYWVPARAEQTDPLHEVSIFYDDPVMMAARIRRLRHPRIHAETPPTRAARTVSNIEVSPPGADGVVEARSVLLMTEFRAGAQTLYHGHVTWRLVPVAEVEFRIRLKRVDLVNAEGMHRGMTVPF
jgi:benzoate/toluate 1,2-dioxygenase beta subunit